jgi:hypothetical protein
MLSVWATYGHFAKTTAGEALPWNGKLFLLDSGAPLLA